MIALLYGNYINENNYNGTLWFLAALFSTYLLFKIINTFAKKDTLKILYTCMTVICGLVVKDIIGIYNIRLPYCIDIALFAIGFYMGGYLYKSYEDKFNINRMYKVFFLLVLGTCIGVGNYLYMCHAGYELVRVDMLHLNFGIIPFFFSSAFCIILALIEGLKILCDKYNIYVIERIGQYSLLFMVIHTYIIQILKLYDVKPMIKLVIVLLFTYIISNIIDFKLPFLYKKRVKL